MICSSTRRKTRYGEERGRVKDDITCLKLANCFALIAFVFHAISPPLPKKISKRTLLVQSDVFRPPTFSMLLSACVGNGGQLIVVVVILLG